MSVSNKLRCYFFVGGADRKETLMERIVIKLSRQVKRHFRRTIGKIKDSRLKTRGEKCKMIGIWFSLWGGDKINISIYPVGEIW